MDFFFFFLSEKAKGKGKGIVTLSNFCVLKLQFFIKMPPLRYQGLNTECRAFALTCRPQPFVVSSALCKLLEVEYFKLQKWVFSL